MKTYQQMLNEYYSNVNNYFIDEFEDNEGNLYLKNINGNWFMINDSNDVYYIYKDGKMELIYEGIRLMNGKEAGNEQNALRKRLAARNTVNALNRNIVNKTYNQHQTTGTNVNIKENPPPQPTVKPTQKVIKKKPFSNYLKDAGWDNS